MAEPINTAVRVTPSAARAQEWAVVLAASGIPHQLEATRGGWALVVAADDAARASSALAAYEDENRPEPVVEAFPSTYGATWIGALVGGFLVVFFAVTGPPAAEVAWFERGSASADHILAGEAWRTVTALTLHVDLLHVLGNALASVVLVSAVGWWLGPGIGSWLVLLAGAGGNALTALAHGSQHVSVGASTATFGAVGVLAALQFVTRRRGRSAGRKAWVVVAASLALLGILGTGAHADLLAHLFGLLVGALLGIGAAFVIRRPPRPAVQWALVVAAAATVVGCWRLALAPVSHP